MTTDWPGRGRALAPGRSRVATWLMSVALLWWVVWLVLVLGSPVRPGSVNELSEAVAHHENVHWLVIQRSDADISQKSVHGLADPLQQHWQSGEFALAQVASDSGNSGNDGLSDPAQNQIAWSDDAGLHVTQDFLVDASWKPDANGLPTVTTSPSAALYRRLNTELAGQRVGDVRALTPYGEISYNGGHTTLNVFSIVGIAGSVVALACLVAFPARYRTRWSWFWIFAAPLGIGLVWYVLREGFLGRGDTPPTSRKSGWRGLGASVLISLVSGPIINYWLFR